VDPEFQLASRGITQEMPELSESSSSFVVVLVVDW
jgi:hypothetical protein